MAIKCDRTPSELAQAFEVHANRMTQWRTELLDGAAGVFDGRAADASTSAPDLKALHAKIWKLTLETVFFSRCAHQSRQADRKKMIAREHGLPVSRQIAVFSISRGNTYFLLRPMAQRDLILMRRMDELRRNSPFAGARKLCGLLKHKGLSAGRKHLATLMKKMGIAALYHRSVLDEPVSVLHHIKSSHIASDVEQKHESIILALEVNDPDASELAIVDDMFPQHMLL